MSFTFPYSNPSFFLFMSLIFPIVPLIFPYLCSPYFPYLYPFFFLIYVTLIFPIYVPLIFPIYVTLVFPIYVPSFPLFMFLIFPHLCPSFELLTPNILTNASKSTSKDMGVGSFPQWSLYLGLVSNLISYHLCPPLTWRGAGVHMNPLIDYLVGDGGGGENALDLTGYRRFNAIVSQLWFCHFELCL